MPDISSAPAIGSPTALYPQPPAQQGALSGNPGQVLDLMRSITQNQMLQNELKARTAIGQAYQGALQCPGALSHHAAAFGGTPENMIDKTSSPDDHLADMQSVMGHYGGVR